MKRRNNNTHKKTQTRMCVCQIRWIGSSVVWSLYIAEKRKKNSVWLRSRSHTVSVSAIEHVPLQIRYNEHCACLESVEPKGKRRERKCNTNTYTMVDVFPSIVFFCMHLCVCVSLSLVCVLFYDYECVWTLSNSCCWLVSYRCRSRCRYCLIFGAILPYTQCVLPILLFFQLMRIPNYITLLQLCFTWILFMSWFIRY